MIERFYIRVIEWLWFSDPSHQESKERIVKVKGLNQFLTDNKYGQRKRISFPYFYGPNIKHLFKRILGRGV